MNTLKPGLYRHYKKPNSAPEYLLYEVARHSETEEELVVYRALYGEHGLWVRPKSMFCETVEVNGVVLPRFSFAGDSDIANL